MSTFDRMMKIGRAYGNHGIEEIEKLFGRSPESDARAELEEALSPRVVTGGGQVVSEKGGGMRTDRSEAQTSVSDIGWAYQVLGLSANATLAEVEEAYSVRDKRMQSLGRQCTKRLKEATDEEDKEKFEATKSEIKELRAKFKHAYRAIKAEKDAVFARFHDLELNDTPPSQPKGGGTNKSDSTQQSSLDAETVDFFKNLELG